MQQMKNTLEWLVETVSAATFNAQDVWDDITALTRKIDVAKRLYDRYDTSWKKLSDSRIFDPGQLWSFCAAWQGLIERCMEEEAVDIGRRLKLINSGLKLIDCLQHSGACREELQSMREKLLNYAEKALHG